MDMMVRVTYQTVSFACDTLMQENRTVSLRAVREYIGHGSMTTISKYVTQWKTANQDRIKLTGVSSAKKKKQKKCITKKSLAVSNSDTPIEGDTLSDTVSVEEKTIGKVIQFPVIEDEDRRIFELEEENRLLIEALKKEEMPLGEMWQECLKKTFSPQNLFSLFSIGGKLSLTLALIICAIWLSAEISGEYFGSGGSKIALGLVCAGGVLSFLAATSVNVLKRFFFRFVAYAGTAAFLMVVFSGVSSSTLKESEDYIAKKQAIAALETQLTQIAQTVATLPADFSKVREKEYIRQDLLKKELEIKQNELSQLKPASHVDLAIYGQFIARFVLDVLIFVLFEILALVVFRGHKFGR